jgi:hypothetical protein
MCCCGSEAMTRLVPLARPTKTPLAYWCAALGKLFSMKHTLQALSRLLTKPFRSGDPQTEASAAEAELELNEARLDAQRRDSYLTR